ncbi:chromosome segregation protein SMC [bacterium]|nr:MAG: chromosome segregation protein SMC [bacterium]
MRLKRVRISGFKTFADKVEFSLEGGIVAVVGPNGCGKSNLVDAILWGLGEGNARSLRAASSQDVIFSGSTRRKPISTAEVVLTFDNDDRALPIDTAEVAISRRLSRSGESDYRINGRSCRLRDVHEMLADSGLGRAGYAIVGQKEIDSALSASAEERRGWLDEAAGVQRYRARKMESQRRLAQAQDHLSRVDDLVRELAREREPLRGEAERARRYRIIQDSLREIEVGLLAKEAFEATREGQEATKRVEEATRAAMEREARAAHLEASVGEVGERVGEVEAEMDAVRSLQQESLTAIERAEAAISLHRQRLEGLDEQEGRLAEEATRTDVRRAEANAELEIARQDLGDRQGRDHDLRESLGGVGEKRHTLRAALTTAERDLNQGREREKERLKQEAERAARSERAIALRREKEGVLAALPDLESAVAEAENEAAAVVEKEGEAVQTVEAARAALAEARKAGERNAVADRETMSRLASLEGRKRGIEATLDAYEGLTQGARAVLEAAERGHLQGEYTLVADAIDVDREFALAIETALGGSANDLIVPEDQDAKEAIRWLKERRAGRATFQPIPLMRPSEPSYELRRLMNERGIVGRASELARCTPRFRPVIDSLLGRVVIAETLDDALQYARTTGWSRIVTLEGEVVHGSGAVSGGVQGRPTYGVVQRRADLSEIEEEIARIGTEVQGAEGRKGGERVQVEAAQTALADAEKALSEARRETADARRYIKTLADEAARTRRDADRIEKELAKLVEPGPALENVDLPALETARDDAVRALAAESADAEQAESRLKESSLAVEEAKARMVAAERRLAGVEREAVERLARAEKLGPSRLAAGEALVQAGQDLEGAKVRRADADERLGEAQGRRKELLEKSLGLAEEAKAARADMDTIRAAIHQAELARTRSDHRRAAALERLFEEYGVGEGEALQIGEVHIPAPEAGPTATRLRRDMKAMGVVNLGAIDAFERVDARLTELDGQREDVLGGLQEVEKAIAELDRLVRDRFFDAFAKVQEAFTTTFQELFGGGEGRLSLTEPDKALDTGVEIEVALPGKRRQPLNLLSGGERSLCATAFLFSLLKVKPSPLVVLDEVDAPLDGRNVERFARALDKLTDRTQFIVITHNPTTIESANVWLGVTMQEPGVSTLVPARPTAPVASL